MESQKFKRSEDRYLGGVLGGIANHFGWNPVIVRIGYALLTVISAAFPGFILYCILWIIMDPPDE